MPNSPNKDRRARSRRVGFQDERIKPFGDDEFSHGFTSDTSNKIKSVRLDDFIVDEDLLQIRQSKTVQTTVREYAQAMKNGDNFPPLTLAKINKVLYLVDGFHRYSALKFLGLTTALVTVQTVNSLDEARLLAIKLNSKHGRKLTMKEKYQALDFYIASGNYMYNETEKEHYLQKALTVGDDETTEQLKLGNFPYGGIKTFRRMERDLDGVLTHKTIAGRLKKFYPDIYKQIRDVNGNQQTSNFTGYTDYTHAKNWKDYNDEITTTDKILAALIEISRRLTTVKESTNKETITQAIHELLTQVENKQAQETTIQKIQQMKESTHDF